MSQNPHFPTTAYHKRETIVLRLTTSNVIKRLKKNQKLKKGMDIKLAKTNIRKQVGGSLLTTILTLGRTLAPTLGKTLGLSALAGLASEGASQVVKKISGKGIQSGGQLVVKPTKSQYGGFLGTLLASIGLPLAIEAIEKITGKGAPRMGSDLIKGQGAPRLGLYQPAPFIGTWEQVRKGGGKKKKLPKKQKSQEQDYC